MKLTQSCYENLYMFIIDNLWKVNHIYMSKIDGLQYISRGDGRSILGGSQEVVKATAIA
jgi:hypothetical protein